jgi:hypothetical protein
MAIKQKVLQAFEAFIKDEFDLLKVNANERSLTHRLAIHVEREFPDYHVDCEYNRQGQCPKKLDEFRKTIDSDDTTGVTVYPDIIVHRRGTKTNFIVIEAKTSKHNEACEAPIGVCACDRCKLRAYKHDLGYQHAFYVVFPVGHELRTFTLDKIEQYIEQIE